MLFLVLTTIFVQCGRLHVLLLSRAYVDSMGKQMQMEYPRRAWASVAPQNRVNDSRLHGAQVISYDMLCLLFLSGSPTIGTIKPPLQSSNGQIGESGSMHEPKISIRCMRDTWNCTGSLALRF